MTMERIKESQLQYLVDRLNEVTGSPKKPWTNVADLANGRTDRESGFVANVGNYHLSYAYGGVCLHRMMNDGGGVTTPLVYGHVPKRELYNQLHAYLLGLESKEKVSA